MRPDSEKEIELKKLAVELTVAMLDNHSGDWNDEQTSKAFHAIYAAVRDA
jgi:hypothetical protein